MPIDFTFFRERVTGRLSKTERWSEAQILFAFIRSYLVFRFPKRKQTPLFTNYSIRFQVDEWSTSNWYKYFETFQFNLHPIFGSSKFISHFVAIHCGKKFSFPGYRKVTS